MTSFNEKTGILFIYGEFSRNVANLYTERYPDRYHPNPPFFCANRDEFEGIRTIH
jgi:hypothetical protein